MENNKNLYNEQLLKIVKAKYTYEVDECNISKLTYELEDG